MAQRVLNSRWPCAVSAAGPFALKAHHKIPAKKVIVGCVLMLGLLGFKQGCVLLPVLRVTPARY